MNDRNPRKTVVGWVVSDRMDKTISVRIERRTSHPLYEKVLRSFKTLKAHDEREESKVGDRVLLMETRPLSKTKRWRLVKILDRATGRTLLGSRREAEEEMRRYQEIGRKTEPVAAPSAEVAPKAEASRAEESKP